MGWDNLGWDRSHPVPLGDWDSKIPGRVFVGQPDETTGFLRPKRLGCDGTGTEKIDFFGMGLGHKLKKNWDGIVRVRSYLHSCF